MFNFTLYNILINKTYFIMKKIIVLIIAIFTINIANVANAQTMVDTNKVWTVVGSINFGASQTSI